jgi:hypothetical protein
MPVEVLTREEVEKMIEEKLRKLLLEMEISKKITELEASSAKLKEDMAKLSIKEAPAGKPELVAAALTRDLAERADLLQIGITAGAVTLKPKHYLGAQDFRAVSDIVKKYGGSWSSQRRMFVVQANR